MIQSASKRDPAIGDLMDSLALRLAAEREGGAPADAASQLFTRLRQAAQHIRDHKLLATLRDFFDLAALYRQTSRSFPATPSPEIATRTADLVQHLRLIGVDAPTPPFPHHPKCSTRLHLAEEWMATHLRESSALSIMWL